MDRNFSILIGCIVVMVIGVSFYGFNDTRPAENTGLSFIEQFTNTQPVVIINNHKIGVELETTKAQWVQGLSGRTSLAPNTGMLFVFDHDAEWGIWMKDMNFAIDIIWMTKDKKIVKIQENATPESYITSKTEFIPDQDMRYVLEVPAGTVKDVGMVLGQTVEFQNI